MRTVSLVLIAIAAGLGLVGLEAKLLGFDEGIFVVAAGLGVFVAGAWMAARPDRGGDVGHPDINPWTIG